MHSPKTHSSSDINMALLWEIWADFWLEMGDICTLYTLFWEYFRKVKKWSNVHIMLMSIRKIRENQPTFFTLNMNKVSSFVSRLRDSGYILSRTYPRKRKSPSVEGRKRLSAQSVIHILSTNKDDFLGVIRTRWTIEKGYSQYAKEYNKRNSRNYFPVDWDILHESVRHQVKQLLGISHPTMKITDIPTIRFATKEELLSSVYFRHFFARSLIRYKQEGYSFHKTIPMILHDWNTQFSSLWLRVPHSLSKSNKTTFPTILWAPDSKMASLLWALHIDLTVWTEMILPREMRWPLPILPNVSIFGSR